MLRENVKTWTTFWIVVLHFIVPDFIEAELLINLKSIEKYLSKTITGDAVPFQELEKLWGMHLAGIKTEPWSVILIWTE